MKLKALIIAIFCVWFLNPIVSIAAEKSGNNIDAYDVLFWSQKKRDKYFTDMAAHIDVNKIKSSTAPKPWPTGLKLDIENLKSVMKAQHLSGVIVTQNGQIILEEYSRNLTSDKLWPSFSVAKSITSTLVGAAIKDGYISGVDSALTDYIPELKNTAYEGVTIDNLLTMRSGVKWSENYNSPWSDIARFIKHKPKNDLPVTLDYMRKLKRKHPPGERFNYNTGETNLAGILVMRATGKSLSDYLSEKIWKPFGMEDNALWALSKTGEEIGGCCLSASMRDYAKFGQFMLDGAKINGVSILPDNWIEQATTHQVNFGNNQGYGYFWWTSSNGTYHAKGIFGQEIGLIPEYNTQIILLGNLPKASASTDIRRARWDLKRDIVEALNARVIDAGE